MSRGRDDGDDMRPALNEGGTVMEVSECECYVVELISLFPDFVYFAPLEAVAIICDPSHSRRLDIMDYRVCHQLG